MPGIEPVLQPVAHALMQVAEETPEVLEGFPPELIWARPGGAASIGFHVAHLAGSLDRLFTYSRGESLSTEQLEILAGERVIDTTQPSLPALLHLLDGTVNVALRHLRTLSVSDLATPREVGRARLPSNTLGLLFHAAEHSVRHGGQVITMVRVLHGGRS